MYKIEYLKLAKEDMEGIIYYVRQHLRNKTAALNLANDFIKCSNNISEFPYGNTEYISTQPLKNKYRGAKVKNFIIFYTINEENKTITIVRVRYQKRNIDKILKQLNF